MDVGVTQLDTAFNYLRFRSHQVLARAAGDLLSKFRVSTKVGYFPGPDGQEHSLAPERLLTAVEQTAEELGREPDLVFLHNPEHSLHENAPRCRQILAEACAALGDAATKGTCGAWGIASWNPSRLSALVDVNMPKPAVLMTRAGLLVGCETLDATDALRAAWGLDDGEVWGMSPFGGSANEPLWERFEPRLFLRDGCELSRVQAAFRIAYALPRVAAVAVGTDVPAHLGELVAGLASEVDERSVDAYRRLLKARSSGQAD